MVKEYFINPFIYVFAFSLVFLFFRRVHKKSLILIIVFFYLISTPLTYNLIVRAWNIEDTKEFTSPYEIAVVSSGVVDHNWYRLKRSQYPGVEYVALNQNKERLFAGIHLLQSQMVKQLYFGDLSVGTFSETEVVRNVVLSQGIEGDRFVVFGEVNSSRDEAEKFRSYFSGVSPKRFLLITSAIHMRRALDAFHKQGLYPDTYSVNRTSKKITLKTFLPSHGGARANKILLYEVSGWLAYYFRGDV